MAIAYFTSQGYTVSIPLTDSQKYDLIVDDGSKLWRVQVKTTRHKPHGIYAVALRTCGGRNGKLRRKFSREDYDLLFVLCSDASIYIIPAADIKAVNTIHLGKDKGKWKARLYQDANEA